MYYNHETGYYLQCYDNYRIRDWFGRSYCWDYYNGRMASFKNMEENDLWVEMRDSSNWDESTHGFSWFGLRAIYPGYISNDAEGLEWYWSDGTNLTFYNWAPGEPNGWNLDTDGM